jgi:hypothetical protein
MAKNRKTYGPVRYQELLDRPRLSSTQEFADNVQNVVGEMVTGNTETLIDVSYNVATNKFDFAVEPDLSLYNNVSSAFITSAALTATNIVVTPSGNLASTNAQLALQELQSDIDTLNSSLGGLTDAVVLKGTWDASAGTFPGAGAAQAGWTYIVSVAGTVDGIPFNINDRLLAILDNASATTFANNWFKLDYTDQVLTVNGQTGTVVLTTADVADSSNKRYVTDAQLVVIGNTSGTNTGDQTNITGNAGTATALQTSRNIGGVPFSGTSDIVPQTIQVVDAASDTTTFPMLAGSATGSLQPLTDSALTYNSSTNALGVPTVSVTMAVFAGTGSPSYLQGKLEYDTVNECLTFYNNDSNVSLQIGQEQWVRVRNDTGSTIANGAVVYVSGTHASGLPQISLADADTDPTAVVAGIATQSISNNSIGFITNSGLVRDVDTSAFSAGARLFLSSTAGALTATAPASPAYRIPVAVVLRSHTTNGTLLVRIGTSRLGLGTSNQILGINNAGTEQEYKTISGTANQITVTHSVNSIALSLPSTINVNAATATALATARSIYGNNFDGSAALTQVIASTYGGTGNGFTKFTGPTTTEKTFTLPNADTTLVGTTTSQALSNKDLTAGTNTFPTFNQNTTGSAAKWTTARNLAGNSVDGSANVAFANKFIVQGTADSGLSGAQFLGALGTGILKNTTTTGVLSVAVAADFPTLNQNTTGSAATLTTARNINGVSFNGSADITVTAAAGTLTGTALNSSVVTSSLTTVGTIGTGTWQGSVVAGQYGGTGVNNSGKTITLGGNLTTSGAFATTLTATGITNVTLPTSGTLATLAGAEALTNKSVNGVTLVSGGSASLFLDQSGSYSAPGGSGTVTSVSVVSANGFAGSVATSTSTPAITISTSVTGVLKGNGTALSAATAGTDYVAPGGALGTPSSGTLTNCTGLPVSTGISGLGTGVATFLATPSSSNLAAAVTGETGSGALVFATSPSLVTPSLGVAQATSIQLGSGAVFSIGEEGSFTPSLIGSTTAGTQTYTRQLGYYQRWGSVVKCWVRVTISAKDGAIAGNVNLGGLPYACSDKGLTNLLYNCNVGATTGITTTANYWLSWQFTNGSSVALLQENNGATVTSKSVTTMAAATDMRIYFEYLA